MTIWMLVSYLLMGLGMIISLVAWVVSMIEGFKVHPGWGIAHILGWCLLFLPQIIFSVLKLDERWPLLVLVLGGIIPTVVGLLIAFVEFVLAAS